MVASWDSNGVVMGVEGGVCLGGGGVAGDDNGGGDSTGRVGGDL